MKLPTHVSESVKRRNPELFGLVALDSTVRKSGAKPALDRDAPAKQRRKSRVAIRVTIILCVRRFRDDDNAIAGGTKALRDAIAESLGIDDGDKRIRFQYGQCETLGETGCIVRIELCA